jgi:pyridoxal phosphate enzyme (YggS family)
MPDHSPIADNLMEVRSRIAAAAARAGRAPSDIVLVAVSKTRSVDEVRAAVEAGVTDLGENYVQEAHDKVAGCPDATWHMIGHLQSNKAKAAVELFDVVQSVDSAKIAAELDKRAASAGKRLDVLIEVAISKEESKSGIEPEQTLALAERIGGLESLRLRGLMGMPPWLTDPEELRPYFVRLRELFGRLPEPNREFLSMGMSGDFETAIEEGSNMVRIGTAIFGPRRG